MHQLNTFPLRPVHTRRNLRLGVAMPTDGVRHAASDALCSESCAVCRLRTGYLVRPATLRLGSREHCANPCQ